MLRVTPASTPVQRVRGFRVVVEPSARTRTYRDYFGTEVVEFGVPGEHDRLAITAEGEVVNEDAGAAARTASWELTQDGRLHRRGGEFLLSHGRRAGQRRPRVAARGDRGRLTARNARSGSAG